MNKTEALPEFLRQRFTGNWLLSDPPQQQKDWLCHAAADEIERLRAENEKLRAALKSFEQIAQYSAVWAADDKVFVPVFIVRAAAAALKETGDES